ncbi:MAG TPA: penicillin-binding protein activator, partial [Steroidobacteraceae bacterium]|nr:penicillin-binding protein activator [Steroidobacteraceae bacterium]
MLLSAGALSGCPSLTERAGLPPSVDRATALEQSGDLAGAARVYEDLAAQNSGVERTGFQLRAARDYLTARRTDDAARVLGGISGPFAADQGAERTLLNAELALDRAQPQEALRQLATLTAPLAGAQAQRYRELRSRAGALAAGQPAGPPPAVATAAPHIAVLLPVTGRAAAAAVSVRDGFMTAYYQTPPAERPRVRIYDTGTQSVADALSQALRQ